MATNKKKENNMKADSKCTTCRHECKQFVVVVSCNKYNKEVTNENNRKKTIRTKSV